ncbi:MAG: phosphatase PAP2 family protein [Oscillospiraceae bacterium]|nr:phosphatase PAP2 family protein [Oscillospiraceae bacterium]
MELLRLIESIRTPFLDFLFDLITRLGEQTVAVAVFGAVFWCVNKQIGYGIGIAYFLSALTVQGMKLGFRVERPWVIDPTLNPVPSALEYATGYSFPSGHTQSAAALLGALAAQIKKTPVRIACFTLAVLVAFSRMYLGVHTLSDVAVSLLLSFLFVWLAVKFLAAGSVSKKRELVMALSMLLYSAAAIVFASVMFAAGEIEQAFLSDCLKAAGAAIGFAAGMYIERVYIRFSVSAKNILWQGIKFILGFAGVLILQEGLKPILGGGLAADAVRYFMMVFWMIALYPLILKRFAPSGRA